MLSNLSDSARQTLSRAEDAAREMNHEYVGTEHLLLAILQCDSGALTTSLRALGVDAGELRAQIERFVQRGPRPVSRRKLPLTPRATHAIELAQQHAAFLQQDRVGPEHLLIGLLREEEGVAGQVLLNLGLRADTAVESIFRQRLLQLKHVARIVRPLKVGYLRKRKIREELLSHLTVIYDEELARLQHPEAAWQFAVERFGKPAQLSRELQYSLPLRERVNFVIERWIGWRAPETGTRWMARLAIQLAAVLAVLNVFAAIWMVTALGWTRGALLAIRAIATVSLCIPILGFILGALYFKVRDATFGVFGSHKSTSQAVLLALLMGLAVFLTGLSFAPLGYGGAASFGDVIILGMLGLFTTLFALLLARNNGPIEIRDTLWACLDLDTRSQSGAPPVEPAS